MSIIKLKQPAVPGISQFLVKKVSQGVRPVSSLLQHINDRYRQLFPNVVQLPRVVKSKQYLEESKISELNFFPTKIDGPDFEREEVSYSRYVPKTEVFLEFNHIFFLTEKVQFAWYSNPVKRSKQFSSRYFGSEQLVEKRI